MGIEEVREDFHRRSIGLPVLEFEQSSATVELAAQALEVVPAQIAKTMAFMVKGQPILIVLSGSARVNNRLYKQCFGVKAKMLDPDAVYSVTGHRVGGVCPFGLPESLPIYLDESLKAFEIVYPAAGTASSAVKMPVTDFAAITEGEWIHVSS